MTDLSRRLALHGRTLLLLILLSWVAAVGVGAAEGSGRAVNVRYRSANTVYLEAGSGLGLAVGDRLEVLRKGETIAEIEVIFVAEHSASCKIVSETQAVDVGDRVLVLEDDGAASVTPAAVAAGSESAAVLEAESSSEATEPSKRHRRTRVSGSITLDWEHFSDGGSRGFDYDRGVARLNLFVRDIGGRPYEVAVRGRALRIDRAESLGSLDPASEGRNRLYEASFTYDPPQGRFFYSVGRLGTNPFVGLGYVDGALGQVRVGKGLAVGGFFGKGVEFNDLEFAELGTKYGAYMRYSTARRGSRGFELYFGGIRENGKHEVSREYAVLDFRYRGPGSWTFSQHTEIDFNRDWRQELSSSTTQLSNLNLVAAGNLAPAWRLIVSYNRNQRYRTVESRLVPEALFDDLWRQGLRARIQHGRPGKLQVSLDAGTRERQQDGDSRSVGLNLFHPNVGIQGLLIGGHLNVYRNPLTNAFMASARIAKTFRRGHEVHFVVGSIRQEYVNFSGEVATQWVRIGGWVELPARMFARAEIEYDTGDDLEGQRFNVGLGYRF